MSSPFTSESFWDDRERYKLTPPRYLEVAAISYVRRLFMKMGEIWKARSKCVTYVDLGCGDCKGTRIFKEFIEKHTGMPVKAVGIDISIKCETLCKEQGIEFLQMDLNSDLIPLQDCQVFTLFETIEHIFNTDFLLQSIRKSISRDGLLLVSTLNVVCWKNRILVPLGIQPINTEVSTKKLSYGYRIKFLKRKVDAWCPSGHIRPFTLYSLKELLEDNGFTVISSHGLENWRAFKFLEFLAKNMCTGILVIAKPL